MQVVVFLKNIKMTDFSKWRTHCLSDIFNGKWCLLTTLAFMQSFSDSPCIHKSHKTIQNKIKYIRNILPPFLKEISECGLQIPQNYWYWYRLCSMCRHFNDIFCYINFLCRYLFNIFFVFHFRKNRNTGIMCFESLMNKSCSTFSIFLLLFTSTV